jgi:hypothetical protein
MGQKHVYPAQIAWAAGLFEGEGSVIASEDHAGHWVTQMKLRSTDQDVVLRFARYVGYGQVSGPLYSKSGKPLWSWQIAKRSEILRLWRLFQPWLGTRRCAQFEHVIAQIMVLTKKQEA